MDWINYREKLGIVFSEDSKYEHFLIKIFNMLGNIDCKLDPNHYFRFCNMTGSMLQRTYLKKSYAEQRYEHIISIFKQHSDKCSEFTAYYMAFLNTMGNEPYQESKKEFFKKILYNQLRECHIPFDILEDSDGCFVFPKGAKELDSALVSEPLDWLMNYPVAHKAFANALKEYADATEDNASAIADKLRKALESFCQEFFGGQRGLENYKSDVGSFLKNEGVPKEISGNFEKILNSYCLFINRYAKHRDATSDKILEFILYQTGSFIRLLITLKKPL